MIMFVLTRQLSALMLTVWLTAASSGQQEGSMQPSLEIEPREIDFGEVSSAERTAKTLTLRNAGNTTVRLRRVYATCSCTRVETADLTITPGQTLSIRVGLDLETYPNDEVSSKIILEFEDSTATIAEVSVRATIRPEYVVTPPILDFGEVRYGKGAQGEITLESGADRSVTVTGIDATEFLDASLSDVGHGTAPMRAVVNLRPDAPRGRFTGEVSIHTDSARKPVYALRIQAQIRGIQYTVSPQVVTFRDARPGEEAGVLEIKGGDVLTVTAAQSNVTGLICRADVPKPGVCRVFVSVAENAKAGYTRGTITVHLVEDELTETTEVGVFGRILPKSE